MFSIPFFDQHSLINVLGSWNTSILNSFLIHLLVVVGKVQVVLLVSWLVEDLLVLADPLVVVVAEHIAVVLPAPLLWQQHWSRRLRSGWPQCWSLPSGSGGPSPNCPLVLVAPPQSEGPLVLVTPIWTSSGSGGPAPVWTASGSGGLNLNYLWLGRAVYADLFTRAGYARIYLQEQDML